MIRRDFDQLARYGKEQFVCVLPETNLTGALLVASKFKGAVSVAQIPHGCSDASSDVTISLGVASIVPGIGDVTEKLISAAEDKLSLAKKNGGNRVEC